MPEQLHRPLLGTEKTGDNFFTSFVFSFFLFNFEEIRVAEARVHVRDLVSGQWSGPVDLMTWGKGYACVSTENGPRWIPARCVKPYLECTGRNRMEDSTATKAEYVGDTG
ncbi:hypothetical protein DUI87_31739 [Hirundo rustica rustica]|uniref:Integrase-type domain-containing protein n=1 Tax=Hirundo rustica rustica TaxID=333673 RepID=A0A3M0IR00_HIRRU|nr:hypothetical protein DUI87_31739 [Hirundo rustica rustica]